MKRIGCIALGLCLGFIMAISWLSIYKLQPVQAATTIRYVATDGNDSNFCASTLSRCRTLQRAINVANPFDEIRVAEGVYTDTSGTVAYITETITLRGGYYDLFNQRGPKSHPSQLDAQRKGRVVEISGSISPTIDGFTITGGNATSETVNAGYGGGILSKNSSPTIQDNVIVSNVAAISPIFGMGGGMYITFAPATTLITGNQVISNVATQGGQGNAGGIYLWSSDATINDNLIRGNSAGFYGGGMIIYYGAPQVIGNEIRSNVAVRNAGGIYMNGTSALIQGNLITDNRGGSSWNGGGMMIMYGSPTINANRILSNSAGSSGGLGLETSGYFTVTNNIIAQNSSGGIMLWEFPGYGLIANNTIAFNTGSEGGIFLAYGYITPTIVNNVIVSNTFGIYAHVNASGTLDYNDVWGNTDFDYYLPGALEPGIHDIQADPLFIDPLGGDFHLQAGSPCINKGLHVPVYSDIDADPRPEACFYDIGADEAMSGLVCYSNRLPYICK